LEDLARAINVANVGPVKTSAEWLKVWLTSFSIIYINIGTCTYGDTNA